MTYILSPNHSITAQILTPDQLNFSLRVAADVLLAWNTKTKNQPQVQKFDQLWYDRKDNFFIEELKRYQAALNQEWVRRISTDIHMHKYMQQGVIKGRPKMQNTEHPTSQHFNKMLQRLTATGRNGATLLRTSCFWPEEVYISHRCKVLRDDYSQTHLKFATNGIEIPTSWQLYPFLNGTPRAIHENHSKSGILSATQEGAKEVPE